MAGDFAERMQSDGCLQGNQSFTQFALSAEPLNRGAKCAKL